jgi:hypothetical protein
MVVRSGAKEAVPPRNDDMIQCDTVVGVQLGTGRQCIYTEYGKRYPPALTGSKHARRRCEVLEGAAHCAAERRHGGNEVVSF